MLFMQLAGVQQSTLVDYPGKVSCIVFTMGCNFRCPFCHNPECVLPDQMKLFSGDLITEEAFFNFLKTRKGFLDGVSICGGEPTLQPDLYDFASKIKEMGFSVKLDTNGRDFSLVKRMVGDGILDYVAVDAKHAFFRYSDAAGIPLSSEFHSNYQQLLDFLLTGNVDYEYRSTLIKGMHSKEDVASMAFFLRGITHYYLQNYVGGNTLDPSFGGQPFDENELREFQEIALQYVKKCSIR